MPGGVKSLLQKGVHLRLQEASDNRFRGSELDAEFRSLLNFPQ